MLQFIMTIFTTMSSKKIIQTCSLIVLSILLFASCSPEKKAEKLIKKEMADLLGFSTNYKALATQLDSTFSPMETQAFVHQLDTIRQLRLQISNLEDQQQTVTDLLHSCQWLIDNYADNPNMQHRIAQKQEEAERHSLQLAEINAKLQDKQHTLDTNCQQAMTTLHQPKQFNGYRATHSYQAISAEGDTTVTSHVFILSANLKEVVYQTTKETYDQGIHKLNQTIRYLHTRQSE